MNLSRYFRLLAATLALCLGWASSAQAAIPATERQVLLDLYASTNGAGWKNKTGWGGAAGTECTWYGVTCDATLNHITEIQLRTNNLVGTLPSISGLTHIQVFRVLGNQLTGSFPSVSGLTSLRQLSFRQNQFTGSLPSLSGLTSLQTLNVSENQLTGSIPSLSDLTALYELDLEINQFSGPVPALPASFPALPASFPALPASFPAFSASASVGAWVCNNSLTSSGNPAIDAAWSTFTGTDWLACQKTAAINQSDCIFNWAETNYSQYFSPAATSATSSPYTYRYYSASGNYLATSSADNHIWVLGPSFGNNLLDVGAITSFLGASGCQ